MSNIFISMNRFGHALLETLLSDGVPIAKIFTIDPSHAADISDYRDFRSLAGINGIPLAHVRNTAEAKAEVRRLKPQHIFVFGWSQLLDAEFLKLSEHGVLGSHPALLPKNRGRAAIPWHFINNEKQGGITFFYMDEGCDSGPIVAQEKFRIRVNDTASDYYTRVTVLGTRIIARLAPKLARGEKLPAKKQNHARATYLAKRTFADGMIDWNKSAPEIGRLIRALCEPYPGAWTVCGDTTLIIDEAAVLRANRYTGVPGQVVVHTDRGMVVQTGRGHIEVRKLRVDGQPRLTTDFRAGQKLGLSIADLWRKMS